MVKQWDFYPSMNRLVSGDEAVSLTGKASEVLAVLARKTGEVVTREEIIQSVWKDLHVTPDLVREYVHDIRSALEDDATNPTYVETIRGKGFRLMGGVSIAEQTDNEPKRPRIAVMLPVVNTDDVVWRGLAFSIGKNIVFNLANQPDLNVISHHATFGHLDTDLVARAGQLNADLILIVTLEIQADSYALDMELVNGTDCSVLAAEHFQDQLDEISKLPSLIAGRVSAELGRVNGLVHSALLRNMRRASTVNRSAYQEYLLSVECENIPTLEAWRRGLVHATRAVELDPEFARAWHMRATFLRGLVTFFRDVEIDRDVAFSDSIAAMRNSLHLDPNDPQILVWSSKLHLADGDMAAARGAIIRSADLGHDHPDTLLACALGYCEVLGAFDEASELVDRGLRISPNPPVWYRLIECRVAFYAGEYDRSNAAAGEDPTSLLSLLFGAMSLAAQNEIERALEKVQALDRYYPQFRPESYAEDMIVNDAARRRYFNAVELLGSFQPSGGETRMALNAGA